MDKGNRLLVFCVWAETERSNWRGANTAVKTGVILQLGDQRWPTLSVPIMAVFLLPLCLSLSPQRVTLVPALGGGSVHRLIDQAAELAWHHSFSRRSLHLYWTSFCVRRTGPWHPEGQLSPQWDNSQTRPCTHGNTLRGYYASRTPFWVHPLLSYSKEEVKERPCLNCSEWRSVAES